MQNIEDFIEDQALELAEKLDQVDVAKWDAWKVTAYHRRDQRKVFHEFYGDQPGEEAVYYKVKRAVNRYGLTVKICPQERGVLGYQNPEDNSIELRPRIQAGLRTGLLIHEWTHAILHSNISCLAWLFFKEQGELEAEATAYIVCKALGITLNGSPQYIRAVNGKESGDLLGEESFPNIKRAATEILSILSDVGLC